MIRVPCTRIIRVYGLYAYMAYTRIICTTYLSCVEKVLATKNLMGTDRNTVRSDQDKTKMEYKFGLFFLHMCSYKLVH